MYWCVQIRDPRLMGMTVNRIGRRLGHELEILTTSLSHEGGCLSKVYRHFPYK